MGSTAIGRRQTAGMIAVPDGHHQGQIVTRVDLEGQVRVEQWRQ